MKLVDLFGVSQELGKSKSTGKGKKTVKQKSKETPVFGCGDCPLGDDCRVPGEGPLDAPIVLVGEAPGAEEELQRRPFVGVSGRRLRLILQQLGVLDSVYITNVVKCRPPGNRVPSDREIKCCKAHLENELNKLTGRKIIVALGGTAMGWFGLGEVEENRGFVKQTKWGPVMGTWHPAYRGLMLKNPATGDEAFTFLVKDLKTAVEYASGGQLYKVPEYRCLMTNDDLRDFVNVLVPGKRFALDFETSSLDVFGLDFRVLSCAVAFDDGCWVFPFSSSDCTVDRELLYKLLVWLYWNGEPVFYNAMFDVIVGQRFLNWGIREVDDVMLMWYLLNGGRRNFTSLKRLALDYTEWGQYGVTKEQLADMSSVDEQQLYAYNATDAVVTMELWGKIYDDWLVSNQVPWSSIFGAREFSLYDAWVNVMRKALYVLLEMKWNGMKVDKDYLVRLEPELGNRMKELQQAIYSKVGMEFNIDSPLQVKKVLNSMGLTEIESTSKSALENYASRIPVIDLILKYREASKLYGTYVVSLLTEHVKSDGCVHADYNLNGSATGRVSSSNPNLQNIPTRMGGIIERAFVSRFEDGLIIKVDFSQHELRVAAAYSGDSEMVNVFVRGEDLHNAVAKNIYGLSEEDFGTERWTELRRLAKGFNFGILYGRGVKSISEELGISEEEASQKIHEYFRFFPRLRSWIDEVTAFASSYGLTRTMWGRVRYLEADDAGGMLRRAINTPVQSAASDIALLVAYNILCKMKERGLRALMVNFIHDAILIDSPKDEVDDICTLVQEEVASIRLPLSGPVPPLAVDIQKGKSWGDCK